MNLYKAAISALIAAPIVGGLSIHMLHNYQEMKQKAEDLAGYSQEQLQLVEAMMEGEEEEYTDALSDGPVLLDGDMCSREAGSGNVQETVLRFHIRANSDSEEDQALKLLVRDGVLNELAPLLADVDDKAEAREILEDHLTDIEEISEEIIRQAGYDYGVDAYFTTEEFPMKGYGDLIFPAGEYEALRVDIGEKNGANWWCVMYPGLCFVDTVGGVVPTDGKEELEALLTPEEYRELLVKPQEGSTIEYRSRIWDWLRADETPDS